MKKRGNEINVSFNFTLTNRWLYTLIAFFAIAIVGVGVYALTPSPGHAWGDVDVPAIFSDGIIYWGEVTDIPADIANGDQVGYNTLAELRVAVSNNFHNLGGTDNVNDADASTTNEIQTLSLGADGRTITLSRGGGSVKIEKHHDTQFSHGNGN